MVFVLGLSIIAAFVLGFPLYKATTGASLTITSLPVPIEPAREFGSRPARLECAGPGRADVPRPRRMAPGDRGGSGRYR